MPVQIRPNGILTYKEREQESADTNNLRAGRAKLRESGYTGKMSAKAASQAKKYVTNWITALNAQAGDSFAPLEKQVHRLCFVTLTLPAAQLHGDREIKRRCLNRFLILLGRYYQIDNYLWRAETQKNGALHFHIIIDKQIPALPLRRLWNICLTPLGYIDQYRQNQQLWHRNGFHPRPELYHVWDICKQKAAWAHGVKSNWNNPNTTDIHQLRNVKNVVAYVVKYVSKNEESRPVNGRLWGCSDDIKTLERFVLQESADLYQILSKGVDDREVQLCTGDGWSFYTCNTATMLERWFEGGADLYRTHWQAQADKLQPLAPRLQNPIYKPPI